MPARVRVAYRRWHVVIAWAICTGVECLFIISEAIAYCRAKITWGGASRGRATTDDPAFRIAPDSDVH